MSNTFIDGKLMMIHAHYWGARVMVEEKDLGIEKVASAIKLGHKYLIPEEIISKFRSVENRARNIVTQNSFPFPIGNANFVPINKFVEVLDTLKKCKAEYEELTDDLVANYEAYKAQMIPVYREVADAAYLRQSPAIETFSIDEKESDREAFINAFVGRIQTLCPKVEVLRGKFSLDWDVFEIALPEMEKGEADKIALDQAEFEETRNQMKLKVSGFVNEVVTTLRAETVELCNKIVTNITEGKVVKGPTLNSLKNFIDRFRDMNFVGDETVSQQLAALKKDFLDAHTTDEIAGADMQAELKRRLGDLAQVAGNMTDVSSVTGEYRRRVSWDQ